MEDKFEVVFLGTGGSCAYSGGDRSKFGINTPCVAVRAGGETMLFDAGSGIVGFAGLEEYHRKHVRLFFSHYHIDHVNGLLFCPHLFDRGKCFDFYGHASNGKNLYGIFNGFLSEPLQPVSLGSFTAQLRFHTISAGDVIGLGGGVTVRTSALSHPGGSTGYRVECGGKSLCYCTDIELSRHTGDSGLMSFIKDTDLLILDAGFEDGEAIKGWGHSSWRECAEWAGLAGARNLALFHYDFRLSDADIETMEQKVKAVFPKAFAPFDGMRITL